AVSAHAEAARRAWLAEQAAANAQAENWRTVGRLSRESAEELWKVIGGSADANQDAWAGELAGAEGAAAFWKQMLERAQDGEQRTRG
ncbi:hypothetical protein ABTZ17_31455, partial [Streptomyces sp. NPDC097619]